MTIISNNFLSISGFIPNMKRQQNLLGFVQKVPRTETSKQETCESKLEGVEQTFPISANKKSASNQVPGGETVAANNDNVQSADTADSLHIVPDCWSSEEYEI